MCVVGTIMVPSYMGRFQDVAYKCHWPYKACCCRCAARKVVQNIFLCCVGIGIGTMKAFLWQSIIILVEQAVMQRWTQM